jgi:hypothetical protein
MVDRTFGLEPQVLRLGCTNAELAAAKAWKPVAIGVRSSVRKRVFPLSLPETPR